MRTVRGNDPFTAIRQLHPSPNILSITHLSKSHMKQHEERSGNFSSFFFLNTLKIDLRDRGSLQGEETWGNLPKKQTKQKTQRAENLLEALMVRAMTCLYLFHLCSDCMFPLHPMAHPLAAIHAFHQVERILYSLPRCRSNRCDYNAASLFQPAPCRVSLPSNFLLSLLSRTFCFVRIHVQYLSIFTALSFLLLTLVLVSYLCPLVHSSVTFSPFFIFPSLFFLHLSRSCVIPSGFFS